MATASTFSHARRRKQTTYGKASRNANAWSVGGFEDDEDELPSVTKVAEHEKVVVEHPQSPAGKPAAHDRPKATVRETHRVEKREHRTKTSTNQSEPSTKNQDEWDVPSSDDEVGNSFVRKSPPRLTSRRQLVGVVQEQEAPLAPWERRERTPARKQMSMTSGAGVGGWNDIGSKTELQAALDGQLQEDNIALDDSAYKSPQATSARQLASPGTGSAAERLKARRVNAKRPEEKSIDSNSQPRKRIRSKPQDLNDPDVDMHDSPAPAYKTPVAQERKNMKDEGAAYTSREPSADGIGALKRRAVPGRQTQRAVCRGKLPMIARSSPRTMTSAPARLTEMLPDDIDATENTARSPMLSMSRPSTPQQSSGSIEAGSPGTARKAALTPKQDQMWKQLLSEESPAASPSGLPMRDLKLHTTRRTETKRTSRMLTKSTSDLGPPTQRTKLVDRLKASAPSSESDETDSEEAETDAEDVDMSSVELVGEEARNSQSQNPSQNTVMSESGPKFTYSRVRSYLPEDSFEDGLMLSLPEQPAPIISRKSSKSKSASQQSTFDFPDTDGEDEAGRLRTVHELRAAGGNQRFLDETSNLLDDIAVHDSSARGRRRSALIELAKKLMDSKAFVEKFFRQGFEHKLLAELEASSDDIADFLLAAAFAPLLSEEAPEYIAQSFKDSDAVSWLTQRVAGEIDARKLVKDRKNNMSKAAQSTFVEFVSRLGSHDTFWGDHRPILVTPRVVALKALDSLIGKLRRSGDRSELVERHQVEALLFSEEHLSTIRHDEIPADLVLSVSVLERLATLGTPVLWPPDVVQHLGKLLVMPVLGSEKGKHLRFLALRLCLSLTNDNIRGCKQLAKFPIVHSLFGTISSGFRHLASQVQDIDLDLLVLEMGVMVNLTAHADTARANATSAETTPLLVDLITAFNTGQKRLLEAETEEETAANVAYGYLAVVLAILCRNGDAKQVIAANLPRKNLSNLVEAVEEFIGHHRRVDNLAFDGEEGGEVWSAFTEKLKEVLERLKIAEQQHD